jgi:putative tricarboxylic transport membrane protein
VLYRFGSIFWLAIGIYAAIAGWGIGLGRFRQPGPGLIFLLCGLLLAGLGIIDILQKSSRRPETIGGGAEHRVRMGKQWYRILFILAAVSVYIYLFNLAGFLLSTFLLMVFLFRSVEPVKWWVAVSSSILVSIFAHVIFKVWLGVPFPGGWFGF